jgi:hypothetical protein
VALPIEYRDVSVYYPRRRHLVEARVGMVSATAGSRARARAALEDELAALAERIYERSYLVAEGVVFCLSYRPGGWSYDIVDADGRYSSCTLDPTLSKEEALGRMRRHFEHYLESRRGG